MNQMPVRTRIAPTPSGYLHAGNIFSFIITWLLAKKDKGTVRLRIDDMDAARMRTEYLEDIFETLDWLGLEPDEGPSDLADFLKNFSQQQRLPLYQNMVANLINTGKVYACKCSRKQILALNPEGIYPGTCLQKGLALDDENVALRLQIIDEETIISIPGLASDLSSVMVDLSKTMGDFIIQRKDGLPAYQVTSLADDLQDRINLIVRGEDLLASSAAQIFIANTLGKRSFSQVNFFHHSLIRNEKSEKLSKSAGHNSLKKMRTQGFSPTKALNLVSNYLHLPPNSSTTLYQLLETFLDHPEAANIFLGKN